jgi:phenylacetate-coenzyme A ligase PaaK-like adenylate-forming protein
MQHRELERREAWTREQIEDLQRRRLDRLLRHAVEASPFYRDLYGERLSPGTAIQDLPVTTKPVLMDQFDRVVIDPRLRLSDLRRHVAGLTRDELYLGRYRVFATSGHTGVPGIFIFDRREWRASLASALRWMFFIGNRPRLPRRGRLAAVAAPSPMHVTRRISDSLDVGLFAKFDAPVTTPIEELVRSLSAFQPDVLVTYPSIAAELAVEELAGRLRIRPRIVSTGAELLTADMRDAIRQAWALEPFNAYGITEAGGLFASECSQHLGLHPFEDQFLFEVVDENNRPVAPGTTGRKVLLTNLFSYTQPLIRYEISDMVSTVEESCPCGRPFRLLELTGGRSDDILYMPGRAGTVPVHPVILHTAIAKIPGLKQYQFVHDADGLQLRAVLATEAPADETRARLERELSEGLEAVGVTRPHISVEFVDVIEREGQAAKLKLVRSLITEPTEEQEPHSRAS